MLQLRGYQENSIEGLRAGIRLGHKRQVLCSATGSGKSIIAIKLIQLAVEKGTSLVFICDRVVLIQQFSKHLDNHGIQHGIIQSKHWRYNPSHKIQVASIQTLEKYSAMPIFDMMIIDEAHAVSGRKSINMMVKNSPNTKIIGLTATPLTKGLANVYSNIVNVITMKELVETGFLVPFRVFIAHEIDTKGIKVIAGEFEQKELETRSLKIIGDVVSDYLKISNEVWGETRKTIVFSSGVAHGKELALKFREVGKNFISISYEDSQEYKDEILADFRKPDTRIDGLVSTDILTRGFDVPDVEHVILARPLRKSLSLHIQMIGRGARISAGKEFCVLQDNSGNYLRFKEDWDRIYAGGIHELNDDAEKPRKELTEREKTIAKCPKCTALWLGGDTCAHCGYTHEKKNRAEAVAGSILELSAHTTKQEKYSSEYKEQFYQQLLYVARAKGHQDGAAWHQYQKKFGVKPPWKKATMQPTPDVLNWLKSRAIASSFARGKSR